MNWDNTSPSQNDVILLPRLTVLFLDLYTCTEFALWLRIKTFSTCLSLLMSFLGLHQGSLDFPVVFSIGQSIEFCQINDFSVVNHDH